MSELTLPEDLLLLALDPATVRRHCTGALRVETRRFLGLFPYHRYPAAAGDWSTPARGRCAQSMAAQMSSMVADAGRHTGRVNGT